MGVFCYKNLSIYLGLIPYQKTSTYVIGSNDITELKSMFTEIMLRKSKWILLHLYLGVHLFPHLGKQ